jgi:hypothetical protein
MTESKFNVGDIVILQNLTIRPECNDLEAMVIGSRELRQPFRGDEALPIEYLYQVAVDIEGFETGLLVAEGQMRYRKPTVELGSWPLVHDATNWYPALLTGSIRPPGTPLPAADLSDMDGFHRAAATDQLAEIFFRLAGANVLPFKPRGSRSEGEGGPGANS